MRMNPLAQLRWEYSREYMRRCWAKLSASLRKSLLHNYQAGLPWRRVLAEKAEIQKRGDRGI